MNLDTMGLTPLWVTSLCIIIALALSVAILFQVMTNSGSRFSRYTLGAIGAALIMIGFAPWPFLTPGTQGNAITIALEIFFGLVFAFCFVAARYYYEERRDKKRKSEWYRLEDEQRRREEKSAIGSAIVFNGK